MESCAARKNTKVVRLRFIQPRQGIYKCVHVPYRVPGIPGAVRNASETFYRVYGCARASPGVRVFFACIIYILGACGKTQGQGKNRRFLPVACRPNQWNAVNNASATSATVLSLDFIAPIFSDTTILVCLKQISASFWNSLSGNPSRASCHFKYNGLIADRYQFARRAFFMKRFKGTRVSDYGLVNYRLIHTKSGRQHRRVRSRMAAFSLPRREKDTRPSTTRSLNIKKEHPKTNRA